VPGGSALGAYWRPKVAPSWNPAGTVAKAYVGSTLPAAVSDANADSFDGPISIILDPSFAGQTIDLNGPIEFTNKQNLPRQSITIDAPSLGLDGVGTRLTVSGSYRGFSVFEVDQNANVTMNGLRITNGWASSGDGGGIYNQGTLALNDVTVSYNYARVNGGGIYNDAGGSLTVTNSNIENNTANGSGGGIYSAGNLWCYTTTITGNTGVQDAGGVWVLGFGNQNWNQRSPVCGNMSYHGAANVDVGTHVGGFPI
jgi:predicted outer membrane repeat protein